MPSTSAYLREKEWSMGHGQCPECCGVSPMWHGHPLHLTAETIGHHKGCKLAAAIGAHAIYRGEYKSDVEYEMYVTEDGCHRVRLKTEEGCPIIKAENEKFNQQLIKILLGGK